jgi:peptide/nickel transport system ATP-binding protein
MRSLRPTPGGSQSARAPRLSPALLVADETASTLDVSIQAQMVDLLLDLQVELRLGFLRDRLDFRLLSVDHDRL